MYGGTLHTVVLLLETAIAYTFEHITFQPSIMPETAWKKLSAEEQRLASKWYWEQGKAPSEIAGLLGRDKSTLTRLLVKQVSRKKQGRPPVFAEADIDLLERRLMS